MRFFTSDPRLVLFICSLIVMLPTFVYSQKPSPPPLQNSKITDNWKYFVIREKMRVEILEYYRANVDCGIFVTASMVIAKTDLDDTIRIFTLCNTSELLHKEMIVEVLPQKEPPFSVLTPLGFWEKRVISYPANFSSNSISKTTWGTLVYP